MDKEQKQILLNELDALRELVLKAKDSLNEEVKKLQDENQKLKDELREKNIIIKELHRFNVSFFYCTVILLLYIIFK